MQTGLGGEPRGEHLSSVTDTLSSTSSPDDDDDDHDDDDAAAADGNDDDDNRCLKDKDFRQQLDQSQAIRAKGQNGGGTASGRREWRTCKNKAINKAGQQDLGAAGRGSFGAVVRGQSLCSTPEGGWEEDNL